MNERYKDEKSVNARISKLAKESRVGRTTIQWILSCEHSISIDKLERLASALRCETYELLMQDKDRG